MSSVFRSIWNHFQLCCLCVRLSSEVNSSEQRSSWKQRVGNEGTKKMKHIHSLVYIIRHTYTHIYGLIRLTKVITKIVKKIVKDTKWQHILIFIAHIQHKYIMCRLMRRRWSLFFYGVRRRESVCCRLRSLLQFLWGRTRFNKSTSSSPVTCSCEYSTPWTSHRAIHYVHIDICIYSEST